MCIVEGVEGVNWSGIIEKDIIIFTIDNYVSYFNFYVQYLTLKNNFFYTF